MDGDCAPPLADIAEVVRSHDAWFAVDDAHGIGVLGQSGGGSCELAAVKPEILIVTFGKAFGMSGAAILCDHATGGDFLTQFARHHVYSTAMLLHKPMRSRMLSRWFKSSLGDVKSSQS